METSTGNVLALLPGGQALVRMQRVPFCARCAAGRGCGAGVILGEQQVREITVSIPRGEDVRPGDDVDVVFDSGKLLAAAVLVYGIPLLGAILGAGVALAFAESDIVAVVGTMLGLGVGMALSRRWLLRPGCQQQYVPVVHTHTRP